jgi:kynureninase
VSLDARPRAGLVETASLYASPNALAPHFGRFRVAERLLLTGHSHQAWPDVGFEGQRRAWLDAAKYVDEKWDHAEQQAELVRAGYRRLMNDVSGDIALAPNTHELVIRLLSALPLADRPRLVTTDGEFHTIRRQLDRLAEAGLDVVKVAARPADSVGERVAAAIDDRTACALISSVYFDTAEIVPNLDTIAARCATHGAELLVDTYHHLNVVPFDIRAMGLERAYVTGGGYKYCQLGEGNGFLRLPPGCQLRPVLTGWFSEFGARDQATRKDGVTYGLGSSRFAGATYDPTSHYRAAAVFDFHQRLGLTPELLREVSRHQIGVLKDAFEALAIDPDVAHAEPMPAERRAGFLAIRASDAARLCEGLRDRGVYSDSRGNVLRLGPAPYLSDEQLRDAIARLGAVINEQGFMQGAV